MKNLLAFSIQCVVFSSLLLAAEPLRLSKSYWKDQAFLKSFNASYRINARIEPSVSSQERGLLVSIQSLMAEGKRKEALKKLTSSSLFNSSAAIAFNAANIQFELGEMESAIKYYKKSIDIFPSFRRAHRNLGFVHARGDDWELAVASLEEAIKLGDQDGATYGQLAYGRMQKEQYASALQAYRLAQITQPESVDWKAGVAQCLQYLRRNEEALALIEEVITLRPEEVSYYLLQSSVLLSLDRLDDAIANLELVRRMDKLDSENHLLLANLFLRTGSFQLARPVMMASLEQKQKPTLSSVLNTLEFTTQVKDWGLARDFAAAIGKLWPDKNGAQLASRYKRLVALVDIESGQNPKRGALTLEALLREDPLDGEALIFLARFRISEKRHQEAIMLLQQAARVEGSEYEARLEMGKVYVTTGRYEDAVQELSLVMKIRPSDNIDHYRKAVLHLAEAAR